MLQISRGNNNNHSVNKAVAARTYKDSRNVGGMMILSEKYINVEKQNINSSK